MCDYGHQFDQAGLFVSATPTNWVKAAVEFADGAPQVGAVVTNPRSNWSLAPCPEWLGRRVTVRASRTGGALIVRARSESDDWRLIRVAPIDPEQPWRGGPLINAPLRSGLSVAFTDFQRDAADTSLHL